MRYNVNKIRSIAKPSNKRARIIFVESLDTIGIAEHLKLFFTYVLRIRAGATV
jgi:hypothetical protein